MFNQVFIMSEDLLQDITIYHKEKTLFKRYNLIGSVRNTSYLNRNNTGVQTTDSCLIRIFDVDGYNNEWKATKGDVIVLKKVEDDIKNAPLTELRQKYGKDYVCEISSIDIFKFDNLDIKPLNHIKIGAR